LTESSLAVYSIAMKKNLLTPLIALFLIALVGVLFYSLSQPTRQNGSVTSLSQGPQEPAEILLDTPTSHGGIDADADSEIACDCEENNLPLPTTAGTIAVTISATISTTIATPAIIATIALSPTAVPEIIVTETPMIATPVITATIALSPTATPEVITTAMPTVVPTDTIVYYTYNVITSYPHDPQAFTQGLVYLDGEWYEGTGLNGRSSLRRVAFESGEVLQQVDLPERYFGEGIVVFGEKIYQLTWQSRIGFVYDKTTFEELQDFTYETQGWGFTHDGERLIMSDGTANIYFMDPESLEVIDQISVADDRGPVVRLNELEYIDGQIYANVWQTDRIAIIDPVSGRVTAWIDLSDIFDPQEHSHVGPYDVLNGIAYDAENERLFVTGKLWPRIFEIELVEE